MFIDLVKKNRSYRGYNQERKLTEKELKELADCARLCASSVNIQPLKYYLSWEPKEVAQIQSLTSWAGALPKISLPHPGKEPTAFIVICQDTDIAPSTTHFLKDVGVAAQTILLAATDRGLGGCMIGNFDPDWLSKALRLPEHIVPMLVVALGEPDETVVLTEIRDGESTNYYRDEQDVHYVPKRRLEDVVLSAQSVRSAKL